jgi:hypothetical protein
MKRFSVPLALFTAAASAGTLYLPAYPAAILVFDESKGQIDNRLVVTANAMGESRSGCEVPLR